MENFFTERRYYTPFIAALIAAVIAYGFELTHFTISIDEEIRDNYLHMIDFGRWGHAILKAYIFPEPWSPFYSLFMAIVFISIASTICCNVLKFNLRDSIIFSVLFSSFPQMAYQLQFSNQAETVGFALVLASSSVAMFVKNKWYGYLSFALLNVLVLSIYQSFLFFSAALITLYCYERARAGGMTFSSWLFTSLKAAALLLISVSAYLLISSAIKSHYNLNSNSYFSSMVSWGSLGVLGGIKNSFYYIGSLYSAPYYGFKLYAISTLGFIIFLAFSFKSSSINTSTLAIISVTAIISPFFLNVIIGNGSPARTLSQTPIIFAFGSLLLTRLIKRDAIPFIFTIVILACFTSNISNLFYSDYISQKQTEEISKTIISDIYHDNPDLMNKKFTLFVHGATKTDNPWKPFRSDDFGVSYIERGISFRTGSFINITGIADVDAASEDRMNENQKNKLKGMQDWPAKGGIAVVDGAVIVKLSD